MYKILSVILITILITISKPVYSVTLDQCASVLPYALSIVKRDQPIEYWLNPQEVMTPGILAMHTRIVHFIYKYKPTDKQFTYLWMSECMAADGQSSKIFYLG